MKIIISFGIIGIIFLLLSNTIFELIFPKNDLLCSLISIIIFFSFFEVTEINKNNIIVRIFNRLF
ncbi:hypothetical protein NRK67_03415 [Fusobacteria bacterium ZRK30]|nr:hypothetical protein NRK67_03415 [Fusobacteria bacterium ZRK30]